MVGDDVEYIGLRDQQVFLVIEQRPLAAVDQGEAFAGLADRQQGYEIILGGRFPLPPGRRRPRGRGLPTQFPETGLDLLADDVQPFLEVQVVEIGAVFLFFAFFSEKRDEVLRAVGGGGQTGGLDAGIAGAGEVVVGTNQDVAAVFFGEVGDDGLERSGIEGDGDRQAGGFMQRGGGSVAFGVPPIRW